MVYKRTLTPLTAAICTAALSFAVVATLIAVADADHPLHIIHTLNALQWPVALSDQPIGEQALLRFRAVRGFGAPVRI
jgi:hypothetical protein